MPCSLLCLSLLLMQTPGALRDSGSPFIDIKHPLVYTRSLGNHVACVQEVKKNNKCGAICKPGRRSCFLTIKHYLGGLMWLLINCQIIRRARFIRNPIEDLLGSSFFKDSLWGILSNFLIIIN